MTCKFCGAVHRYVCTDEEQRRFREAHKTRTQFDIAWSVALFDRTWPDDAFCIAVQQGRAGFVPHNKETHEHPQ